MSNQNMSDARIQIHLDVNEPIELVDLTLSFQAIAYQYKKYLSERIKEHGGRPDDSDVTLYITKIESNCILAELGGAVNILGQLFSILDYLNIFIEFTKYIQDGVDYFRALTQQEIDPREIKYTKAECQRFADLLDVAAKSKEGSFGVSAIEYESQDDKKQKKVHLKIQYTSEEAYEAQRGALLAQKALEYKGDADHKKVLMYFYQANVDDPKVSGKSGDKVVIKTVTEKPLVVYFVSDIDRQRIRYMLDDPDSNLFRKSFIVDVNVETDRNDQPKFYRVINIHEVLDDNDP